MQTSVKVVVVGGAGQVGKIHVANLVSLGAEVASFDVLENAQAAKNYNAKEAAHAECVADGYKVAIVALPDHMLFPHTDKILDAGFERIMIEKPGSLNSADLEKLAIKAEEKGVTMYIDYQRQFDPRISQLNTQIKDLASQGYSLDYVSVYSCDKSQPPQAAHQYINQGCHDYALFLGVLESSGMKLKDMQSRGVEWEGTNGDTKFFKITGSAQSQDGQQALYDVQMGRVNSTGSFTDIYVKMSKLNDDKSMYEPFEQKFSFPEVPDPNAQWADVWKTSFVKSAESLMKGENGVPLRFGLNVLKFAEMAKKSYQEGSSMIQNDFI